MQFNNFSTELPGKPVHVLLVEDDEVDAEAVERAFANFKISNLITVVSNGYQALDVLRGTNGRIRLPRPYIILLDLNMPRMGGIEFLQHLRADPELKTSVVFVLTTSNDAQDRVDAYNSHVAGYILKTGVGQHFFKLPEMMQIYWRLVELPGDR